MGFVSFVGIYPVCPDYPVWILDFWLKERAGTKPALFYSFFIFVEVEATK